MPAWDRLDAEAQAREQRELLRRQLTDHVGPHSPLWRARFSLLGRSPAGIASLEDLGSLPALGEGDVSRGGDPADMAELVLRGDESGFALHADGPVLRKALLSRLRDRDYYRRIVDSEQRATSFAWTGLGFRWPVAYTRGDLDVVARAGARAWAVLGLTPDDPLLAISPPEPTPATVALHYAALAAGAPAISVADDTEALRSAARLLPPTVLALPAERLGLLAELFSADGDWNGLHTLLVLGMPDPAMRQQARRWLPDEVAVLVLHVPSGGRLPWVECRPGGEASGLHTMPDLEIVQLVDAETGEPTAAADIAAEPVVTQLRMRGSALLRWRTGDLVTSLATAPCPGCRRSVPRLVGLRAGALVVPTKTGAVDLRAVCGALAGRADLTDWRVVVAPNRRDGRRPVQVHLLPADAVDPERARAAAASDIREVAGRLPTQPALSTPAALEQLPGWRLTARIRLQEAEGEPPENGLKR